MAGAASASASRTFVASTGSDSNACTLSGPCRSFATAIAHTSPGGEIVVLDSAGYGPVTITQSVSIVAPAGLYAGITASSSDGITVNAGAGDNILLRGLTIDGETSTQTGIVFESGGSLTVEDCEVSNIAIGIQGGAINGSMTVRNSVVHTVTSGVATGNGGFTMLDRIRVYDAGNGVTAGIESHLTVRDSVISNTQFGVVADGDFEQPAQVTVSHSTVSRTRIGIAAETVGQGTTPWSLLVSDGNVIDQVYTISGYGSGAAFYLSGPVFIFTPGNNTIGFLGAGSVPVSGGSLTPIFRY